MGAPGPRFEQSVALATAEVKGPDSGLRPSFGAASKGIDGAAALKLRSTGNAVEDRVHSVGRRAVAIDYSPYGWHVLEVVRIRYRNEHRRHIRPPWGVGALRI